MSYCMPPEAPEMMHKSVTQASYLLERWDILLAETHVLIVIFRYQCWENQEQLRTTEIRDFWFFLMRPFFLVHIYMTA